MSIQHTRSYKFGFALNKQSDVYTPVADAKLSYMRSLRTFAPITREYPAQVSDRAWFGKGHGWPTFWDGIQQRYVLPSTERSATSLELLYAAAYVMGHVVTSMPNSTAYPAEFQHVITWQDIATNKEVLFTTLVEQMGAEYKKKLTGAWISQFTVTGDRADHVRLSLEGGGRKYEDWAGSMPTISNAAFYKTLFGTVKFGPDTALVLNSDQVLSYNFTFNQNPQPYHLMGEPAGEEGLVSKVLIGDQTVSGQIVIFVDVTARNLFLNQTRMGLELNLISPTTIGASTVKHSCKIEIPHLQLISEAFGEDGQTVSYTLAISEDSVLKIDPDEHAKLTFLTDIGATELLVVSP